MSLIELLCVIAIIALLTALLLPAIGQAKARARRLQCIDHLHEIGVGFVSFASDHGGRFPMAVPTDAGGSWEYAQGGYLIEGDFYFSFRHFQAASNELVTPKLLTCPSDTRPAASGFATLSNAKVSYFIGVNAEFARPMSILAGDRNLTNDFYAPGTLVRLGENYALRWTAELHRFKGNLLFSDTHVEERNSFMLVSARGQGPGVANVAFPTVRQPGAASLPGGRESSAWGPATASVTSVPESGSSALQTNAKAQVRELASARRGSIALPERGFSPVTSDVSATTPPPPRAEKRSTNEVGTGTSANPETEKVSPSEPRTWLILAAGELVKVPMWGFYIFLLLIAATTLVLRRLTRGRGKGAGRTYQPRRGLRGR